MAAAPEEDEVAIVRAARHSALAQIVLVLGTWWIGALVLMWTLPSGVPAGHALFETASAVGGVGLTTGITDASLPAASKLVLTALMWLGRLEIVPVLILFWQMSVVRVR